MLASGGFPGVTPSRRAWLPDWAESWEIGGFSGEGRSQIAIATMKPAKALTGKKGVTVGDAMDAVLASGYKTTSKGFRSIVNQTLIKDKQFKNVGRGKYALKAAKTTVAKKAKAPKK